MRHWLIKSEPTVYSFDQLVAERRTAWTGIRNNQARLWLMEMQPGDRLLYYHSNVGKEVVGIAEVVKTAYPDPTADDPRWVCVDVAPVGPLKTPVSLQQFRDDPLLKDTYLVKQGRLSTMPLSPEQYARVLALAGAQPLRVSWCPPGGRLAPYVAAARGHTVAFTVTHDDRGEVWVDGGDGPRPLPGGPLHLVTSHPALARRSVLVYGADADGRTRLARLGPAGPHLLLREGARWGGGRVDHVGPLGPTVTALGLGAFRVTDPAGNLAVRFALADGREGVGWWGGAVGPDGRA